MKIMATALFHAERPRWKWISKFLNKPDPEKPR
jgi:hypothetical protein